MKYTNSLPCVNGDKKLNVFERVIWLFVNFLNNSFDSAKSNLTIHQFIPKVSSASWSYIDKSSSPSRVLSDLFWFQTDWLKVENELGQINILDTGCGSGEYFFKFNKFSHNKITNYCGIDIEEKSTWESLKNENSNINFKKINSNNLLDFIPTNTNLFVSQSAIEHFEEDLVYFSQIKDFIDRTKNNTIQIHLFPSSSCLTQYVWHGIRQYTPRSISKITKIFEDEKSYSVLYKLGGKLSNKVHRDYITIPMYIKKKDDRELKKDEYIRKLQYAIEHDINGEEPSFYALVIHSNYENIIFENMKSLI